MNRKFKIGIVGVGKIFNKHYKVLKKLKKYYDLKCVCEIDEDKISKMKSNLDIPIYQTLDQMVKNNSLDLVTLCTPSGIHAEQAIFLSEHKIDIVTEKPIAINLNDADDMIKSCESNGVNLFVVKPLRYNKVVNLLRNAVSENRFGKIHLINMNIFWTRPQSYYDEASWRGTIQLDGGALMNQANHYIDILNYLFGIPEKIQCFSKTERNIETEDTTILNIKWSSGILCSVNVTMLTFEKNLEDSITIIGEDGTVKVSSISKNIVDFWKFKSSKNYDNNFSQIEEFDPLLGHENFYNDVYYKLNENNKKFIDLKSRETLKIIVDAINSSKINKSVKISL